MKGLLDWAKIIVAFAFLIGMVLVMWKFKWVVLITLFGGSLIAVAGNMGIERIIGRKTRFGKWLDK